MLKQHENTDASAQKIMWVALLLIVGSIITLLIIAGLFFLLRPYAELPTKLLERASPSAFPLLEVDPIPARRARLAKEKQILESYGWVDYEKQIARIPIKQAIEILVHEH